jgi:hypothetical protein
VHQVRRDLAGRRAPADDAVHAELIRGRRVESRSPHHEQRPALPHRLGERRGHLAGVVQVRVWSVPMQAPTTTSLRRNVD